MSVISQSYWKKRKNLQTKFPTLVQLGKIKKQHTPLVIIPILIFKRKKGMEGERERRRERKKIMKEKEGEGRKEGGARER